jgi:energy-coupling factor transporter ATP-binding protein EcfA2
MTTQMLNPFGLADCESEIRLTGADTYRNIYFNGTPFDDRAQDNETYLVVGRRGSGKSALAQSFTFRMRDRAPLCIEVERPEKYKLQLETISRRISETPENAVWELRKLWEYVIWQLIAGKLPACHHVRLPANQRGAPSGLVAHLIGYVMSFFDEDIPANETLDQVVGHPHLAAIRTCAVEAARRQPIVIALDTLEHYPVDNLPLLHALAALVEYAADFNLTYVRHNIHLKVFVPGESFPHLKESILRAPAKSIRNPVYMLWRPKDLLRLICWRLYRHLERTNTLQSSFVSPQWHVPDDVLNKVWRPHFGTSLTTARGLKDDTWIYILRHTQMRPRQIITICNEIANLAIYDQEFPKLNDYIVEGTKKAEAVLANEIISSFDKIYPKVGKIVSVLNKMPMVFGGNELDRRAHESHPYWNGDYSPAAFRRLVTELGIVGRVSHGNADDQFIDADFEYSLSERLDITHRHLCVIHPMFYRWLDIDFNSHARVMPFSSHTTSEH